MDKTFFKEIVSVIMCETPNDLIYKCSITEPDRDTTLCRELFSADLYFLIIIFHLIKWLCQTSEVFARDS